MIAGMHDAGEGVGNSGDGDAVDKLCDDQVEALVASYQRKAGTSLTVGPGRSEKLSQVSGAGSSKALHVWLCCLHRPHCMFRAQHICMSCSSIGYLMAI